MYPFLLHFSQPEPFRSAPDHSNWHCVGVYTLQATASEGLAQGPYVTARDGIGPRDPPVERHRLYQSATTPHNTEYTNYTFLLTIIKLSGARDIFQILVILQLPGKNANSNSLQVLTLSGDITILLASPNRLLISSECTIKNCRKSKHLFIIIWSKLL